MRKLQVVQKKSLRLVFDTQLHMDAVLVKISDFVKESVVRMYDLLAEHANPLMSELGDYDKAVRHRHRRPRMIVLS